MKSTVMLALLAAWGSAHAASVTYDIYVESGKRAGEQVVERGDDGVTRVKFAFKDNGRGPDLVERIRYAPDGTMTEYQVKGASTFGAAVDEHFELKDGMASWRSTTETGHTRVGGTAMYVPLNSSFEFASAAVGALAARSGGTLALLPSGTLTQKKLDELQVTGPDGKTQTVQLIATTGIGLSPNFVWATLEARPRLFGVIQPAQMNLVEHGWDAAIKPMREHQKLAEQKLLNDLAVQLQHPLDGLTVVRNARVFDSDKAVLTGLSDVYVLRGRITAVLPAGAPMRGVNHEIDATGKVLLPGLFDMHAHVNRWEGGLNLAAGVTSVRDMGNDNAQLQLMLDEMAHGKLLGPQIVPAGFLEGESPYSSTGGFVIKDLAGAKSAVDWYVEHGYPQLKIYNSFPKAILKETIAYAHSRGMRVSGHIPAGLRAFEALDAGYDEIQHINQVMLNFLATPQTETRTLERFVLPADQVATLDFNSPQVKQFIARLARQQTVIDETLATFAFLKQKDGDLNEPFAPVADHMPPDIKRGFYVGTMNIPNEATLHRYEKSYAKMVQFVGMLYRAGVPLVAGTDELAGFTLQAELEMLVKAGLTPAQVLQVATRNGARYTRTSHERGSITAGKLADLVLIDGDPTRTIGDVRKVSAVITRGYLIYPREIDRTLGIEPFVAQQPELKTLPVQPGDSGSLSTARRRGAAVSTVASHLACEVGMMWCDLLSFLHQSVSDGSGAPWKGQDRRLMKPEKRVSEATGVRVISGKLAMGIAMLTIAVAALAGQQQSPVVLIQYVVGEKSPDVVEEVVTSPIERDVRSLRRVTGLRSTTENSGTGVTVAVEISFEGGATSLDLKAVLKQVSQLEIKANVELTSVTVQLLQPHEDNNVRSPQR